jgi:hypothetical protein
MAVGVCFPRFMVLAVVGVWILQLGFLTMTVVEIDYDEFYRTHYFRFAGFFAVSTLISAAFTYVSYSFLVAVTERTMALFVLIAHHLSRSPITPSNYFFSWFIALLGSFANVAVRNVEHFSMISRVVRCAIPTVAAMFAFWLRRYLCTIHSHTRSQSNMAAAYPVFIGIGVWCMWTGLMVGLEGGLDEFCGSHPQPPECGDVNVGLALEMGETGILFFLCMGAAFVIPAALFWRYKARIWGVAAKLFERKHRIQDGAFIAALMDDMDEASSQQVDLRTTQATLTTNASHKLRRIRFSKFKPELLTSSLGKEVATFDLSEPCELGQIDYFISHSWQDNAQLKYDELSQIATVFQERHGRECTFWFDKVCLNQNEISEDLKCLPIFVMACKNILILYGDSYLSRLWCIWELYVFFATSVDTDRVLLRPMGNISLLDVQATLSTFNVANARCFMQQDEDKLRSVIRSGGEDLFNETIRGLAGVVNQQ